MDKLPLGATVDFSGWGEPQLNPAFTDMVLYAHSTGHPMLLYSTFVGITRESYERIRTIPFKTVVLHIPDQDGNSHFEISEQYLELLDLVLRDSAAGRFRITGYSCHGPVHPAVADIFKKNGLSVPTGTPFNNLGDRAGNLKNEEVRHSPYVAGHICCRFNAEEFSFGVLLPDGTVCLCCQDMGMDYVLGNLLMQSYNEIMRGEELRKLRRCMKCEKAGDCLCRHCGSAVKFNYFKLIRRKVALRTRIKNFIKRVSHNS